MRKQIAKRGFTVTELVIVIVVIAILAAVLIPTFASLIKKANRSADVQLVRSLNVIVAAETSVTGGEISPHGAIIAAEENGYKVEKLTPTSEDRTIVWDAANYRFALLDENKKEIFPKDKNSGTPAANMFVISDTYPAENFDGYAVYLTEGYTGDHKLTVTTGLDVGYNDLVTGIVYNGTDEVAIRGEEHTTIEVNSGKVHHYDTAFTALVNAPGEYVEHGKLMLAQGTGSIPDAAGFAGGAGTEENPYLIADLAQLKNLGNYATQAKNGEKLHVKLVSDVVADSYVASHFAGTLDGDGHTITITADVSNSAMIHGTVGDTVIKNLEIVQSYEYAQAFLYSANYDPYTGKHYAGTTTFENVTVRGADPDATYKMYGKYSNFVCQGGVGNLVFKNCVNEVNYTVESNYASVFVGNYVVANWNTVVFDGCINRGFIQGPNVYMFCANNTTAAGYPVLVNDPNFTFSDAQKTQLSETFKQHGGTKDCYSAAIAYYINDCKNEGVIMGTNSATPYSTYVTAGHWTGGAAHPCYYNDAVAFNDALAASGEFDKGMMFVSSVDVGLKKDGSGITIVSTDDSHVKEYQVIRQFGLTFKNDSHTTVALTDIVPVADAASYKLPLINKFVSKAEYDETAATKYADLTGKQTVDGYEFVIVDDTLIVNTDGKNIAKIGGFSYTIIAKDGTTLYGSKHYVNLGNVPAA